MSSRVPTAITVLALLTLVVSGPAHAAPLRVCADPDNLPFTSADPNEKGLYLEVAELLAARLGTVMEPLYVRDTGMRGLRQTLAAGRCDVFFGLPYRPDGPARSIRLTRPFLEVGYAVVAPRAFVFQRLADLDGHSVGVQFASTPQTLLSARDAVRMVTFKTAEDAVDAVGKREVETAFVWGPSAGYRAARRNLLGELKVVSTTGLGLRGSAAVALRAADQDLRERLDHAIDAARLEILELAEKYHVPLDAPVDLEAAPVADTAEPAPTPTPPAPAPSDGKVNPYRGDAAAVVAGRTLFNVHCSHCHSPNAQSPDPTRDLRRLNLRYGDRVNDVFFVTVTWGRLDKGMPVWGLILDEDTIWKIKTFLESVQKKSLD